MSYQQQLNDAAKRCHVGSYAVGANRTCAAADATIAAKDAEIASLRAALDRLLCATEGHDVCPYAKAEARYVLAQVAEAGK